MLSRFHSRPRLSQAGDTIVEIMIVLAVLGLAIGISYATADSSLKATRQAQDASQATDLLQGQIEALRTLANLPSPAAGDNIYTQGPYCLSIASASITVVPWTNPTTPGTCAISGSIYTISVTWSNTAQNGSPEPDTFTAVASWDDTSGQGTDTSTLVYRIHNLSNLP